MPVPLNGSLLRFMSMESHLLPIYKLFQMQHYNLKRHNYNQNNLQIENVSDHWHSVQTSLSHETKP